MKTVVFGAGLISTGIVKLILKTGHNTIGFGVVTPPGD